MGYCGAAGGRSDARGIVWGVLAGFGGVRSWGALGLMEGSRPYGVGSGGWIGVCPGPKRWGAGFDIEVCRRFISFRFDVV